MLASITEIIHEKRYYVQSDFVVIPIYFCDRTTFYGKTKTGLLHGN